MHFVCGLVTPPRFVDNNYMEASGAWLMVNLSCQMQNIVLTRPPTLCMFACRTGNLWCPLLSSSSPTSARSRMTSSPSPCRRARRRMKTRTKRARPPRSPRGQSSQSSIRISSDIVLHLIFFHRHWASKFHHWESSRLLTGIISIRCCWWSNPVRKLW